MEVLSRPYVLDTGSKANEYCTTTQMILLPTGITIAYQVFELRPHLQIGAGVEATPFSKHGESILMIMGLAACGTAWLPTIRELFSRGDNAAGLQVAIFDNRGVGRSSCPARKEQYTTDCMASDALALMDHLSWRSAHVIGHSMGAMIASRLALAAPDRVASLTLISTTGGGMEAIPLNSRVLLAAFKGMLARPSLGGAVDPVKRAQFDVTFHFTPKLLKTMDPVTGRSVRDLLVEDYITAAKESGPQPQAGERGHLHAVMKHGLSAAERRRLAGAGFPIKVIHGMDDIIAEPRHAQRLAMQLRAPLLLLDGAHFITRDCSVQIVDEILSTLDAVRHGATHKDSVHLSIAPRLSWCCC